MIKLRFKDENEGKTCYCKYCKQWVTRKECRGIACVRCYDMLQKINEHNESRRGHGLKFPNELWQFSGHVFRKNARDNNYMAYHSPKYDKIFIDLLKFVKKDGSIDIEGIVTTCVHEFNHVWLEKEINWIASKMFDYCGIREMFDKESYLGFYQDYGDKYYDALCKKQVETEKWLKKYRDKD